MRTLEEKLVSLYRGGQISGGVYIGKGQEAVSVACGLFLEKGDIFAPLIRDQAGRSAFGEPLIDVTRTYLGSRLGPMRGRDGNIHRGHPRNNELTCPLLEEHCRMVMGLGKSRRLRKPDPRQHQPLDCPWCEQPDQDNDDAGDYQSSRQQGVRPATEALFKASE